MDAELLRRACEVAGLIQLEDGRWALFNADSTYTWAWFEDDPALPSYVAELLVAKVRKLNRQKQRQFAIKLDRLTGNAFTSTAFAMPEDRIRAAMEVLG